MQADSKSDSYAQKVQTFLINTHYKKIVLQLPREMLSLSFDLVSALKKRLPDREFFVLYDSLKQACCVDTLGAEHVNYDCLVHFGPACFSSPHQSNHFYVFPQPQTERLDQIRALLSGEKLNDGIREHNIGYLLVDQPFYQLVRKQIQGKGVNLECLRLAHEAEKEDDYLVFGYYAKNTLKEPKNLLIITDLAQPQSEQLGLIEKISFTLKSLQTKLGQKIFTLGEHQGQPILQQKINTMKRLMQRYSIISQLQNYETFGILVSNTGTSFVDQSVSRCQYILKKHNKKSFLFMMNNLNEVKLGNFGEIEVYIIISCHNHSLFSVKDFHRLVIAPIDLEIAFQKRNFDQYGFDNKAEQHVLPQIPQTSQKEKGDNSTELQKLQPQQLTLQSKLQTLTFYRQRQYKGLQFSEKKQIKKLTKGKIGLAQQYTNLQ